VVLRKIMVEGPGLKVADRYDDFKCDTLEHNALRSLSDA